MSQTMPKSDGAVSYDRDQVVKIINSVLTKVEQSDFNERDTVFQELCNLQKIIEETREKIGAVKPAEITDKHIPAATDELDAVVESTAEATGNIMDACEAIEAKASAIGGENGNAIVGEVTKIYEACSFQDITGQRITKVVSSIKVIEEKVAHIVSLLSSKMSSEDSDLAPSEAQETDKDKALLNGPQMPDQAFTQDDIDKILNEFD